MNEILGNKGQHLYSVGPDATVLDAAIMMNEHKIGCLLVVDDGRISGIFTERDVLRRVVAERRDPATVTVGDVMTREVVCCAPGTPIDEARSVFLNRRIRHLPVCEDDGRIVGLISIGDLNAHHNHTQERHIHFLQEYIQGRA